MNKFLLKNWQLKILAVISAIILWLFVVGTENTVSLFPQELDIELVNIDENVGISDTLPKVKIYIKADKEMIKNLTVKDFTAQIDLEDLTAGEYTLPVNVLSKNPQVSVIRAEPKEVRIKLSPRIEKEVDILTSYAGNPAVKYKVQSLKAEPDKVRITATQSVLDKIKNVEAKFVLDGAETETIEQKVTLTIPEKFNVPHETISINPSQVMVEAIIVPDIKEKEVPVKVTFNGTTDEEGWRQKVTLNPAKVKITGENFEEIEFIETAPIDINRLINSRDIETVGLILPDNISLVDAEPVVTVSLNDSTEKEKEITALVTLTGQNALYKVKKYSPLEFKVTVSGASAILNGIGNGNIVVEFNIGDITESGTYPIDETNIVVPEGVLIKSFTPEEINVEAESLASI
jgi:YbbR domain-containing protein